jgi:uncharacterized repeat protein (TIGR04138 family)
VPAQQVLDKIRTELIQSGRDTRYPLAAYVFVLDGLDFYMMKLGQKRHVSGQEFSRGLTQFALGQFGRLAGEVLGRWGIRATSDFGYIVYNLIGIGVMSRQERDSLSDFFDVLDIAEACRTHDPFTIDPEYIRSVRSAGTG